VGHLDGYEENTDERNLIWNCRACNTKLGRIFTRLGLGRRTRQYNPPMAGAKNLGQWMNAVMSMKGESGGDMSVSDAVAVIHATSPDERSGFAREIWAIRRGRTNRIVPF